MAVEGRGEREGRQEEQAGRGKQEGGGGALQEKREALGGRRRPAETGEEAGQAGRGEAGNDHLFI